MVIRQAQTDITAVDGYGIGVSARVFNVGQDSNMYSSVQSAVDAILDDDNAPSATNRAIIKVWPGKYISSEVIIIPSWVGVQGVSKGLVQFQNDTTDLFRCSGNNWFEDFLVEGSSNSSVYAFDGYNSNAIHIRRVDMLHNGGTSRQKFLKQVGSTWSILFIEDCIIDMYATSGYAVFLHNTGAAARFCDTIINNVFFDAFHLTGFGGSFQIRGCQDVRIRNSTIRGVAVWNTGVRVELGGVTGTPRVDIRHCYLEGGVPVYGESGTNYLLINTDAIGALTDGTRTLRNSSVT